MRTSEEWSAAVVKRSALTIVCCSATAHSDAVAGDYHSVYSLPVVEAAPQAGVVCVTIASHQ